MKNTERLINTLRHYYACRDDISKAREAKLSTFDDYKGSKFYNDQIAQVNAQFDAIQREYADECRMEIDDICKAMTDAITKREQTLPTADQQTVFDFLNSRSKLTQAEFDIHTATMRGCPVLERSLVELAERHNLRPERGYPLELKLHYIPKLIEAAQSAINATAGSYSGQVYWHCFTKEPDRFYRLADIGEVRVLDGEM